MIRRLIESYGQMREHRWTNAHFSAYLESELGEAERARLERHARICPQCHRMLETLKRTLEGLRALPAGTEPPSGLADSVIERLRQGG